MKKLRAEARKRDLTLIGAGRSGNYRIYRFDSCGHEQEISVSQVRAGYLLCHSCEETAWDLPSFVYLLQITYRSKTWLKLGYAADVELRINQYGLPKSANYTVVITKQLDSGRAAQLLEKRLHKKFKPKRIRPSVMKKLHSKSGSSECYPAEILKSIETELCKIKKSGR